MSEDKFDTAKFYTCDDCAERLTHDSWDEALWEWLEQRGEGMMEDGESEASWLRRVIEQEAPVEVFAYVPVTPSSGSFDHDIECLVENMQERWMEEYGSPDPFDDKEGPDLTAEETAAIENILNAAWKRETPWACDEVAKREYSKEDLFVLFASELKEKRDD